MILPDLVPALLLLLQVIVMLVEASILLFGALFVIWGVCAVALTFRRWWRRWA